MYSRCLACWHCSLFCCLNMCFTSVLRHLRRRVDRRIRALLLCLALRLLWRLLCMLGTLTLQPYGPWPPACSGDCMLCFANFTFILFSPLAGQMADKFSKSQLIVYTKVAEICIMTAAFYGFYSDNIILLMFLLLLVALNLPSLGRFRLVLFQSI